MSKLTRQYPMLGSSVDSTKLSLMVKGLLVALVPVIVVVAQQFSVVLSESDLVNVIDLGATVLSAVLVFWGGLRKLKKN